MNINATTFGQIAFVLAIIVFFFTLRFAKRSTAENLPLVGFYSLLLNLLLPPGAWVYCGYWYWKSRSLSRFETAQ
ncbi:hypothetical protein DU002_02920 [Corallincola holothuriorum]|uniref:Uncharacterized protein n=1 Tax=Corallincola holothuriorum TaxID=2282215 RepID=A0A368NUP4_9GAMM|nr:hypothetical protein DU002_02920 [Corallincola holothuriorum]